MVLFVTDAFSSATIHVIQYSTSVLGTDVAQVSSRVNQTELSSLRLAQRTTQIQIGFGLVEILGE